MIRLVTAMLICVLALCQDALVVRISDDDASRLKALYEAKVAAESAFIAAKMDIQKWYVSSRQEDITGTKYYYPVAPGWESGIQFSPDFKTIVPAPSMERQKCGPGSCLGPWCGSGITYTPAVGSWIQSYSGDTEDVWYGGAKAVDFQ